MKERNAGNKKILTVLFRIYGVVCLALAAILNKYTFLLFSSDGLLGEDTILRIYKAQIIFLFFGVLFFIYGRIFKRSQKIYGLSSGKLNIIVPCSLSIFLIFCLESALFIPYSASYISKSKVPIALYDKYLGHVLNPNLNHAYKINSLGFRGKEFNREKPANEIRTFVVGDSITFGWGLMHEDATYPYKLQLLLKETRNGRIYNVVNAGIPSYTSLQALRFIEKRILPLGPDLVILCIGWNDLKYSYKDNWQPAILVKGAHYDRIENSFSPALFRAARDLKSCLLRSQDIQKRIPDGLAVKYFKTNLRDIIDILRKHKVRLIILNLPTLLNSKAMTAKELSKVKAFPEVNNLRIFQNAVDNACQETNSLCLNLFGLDMVNKDKYFFDHCHLTEAGSAVFARQIFDFISNDSRFRDLF